MFYPKQYEMHHQDVPSATLLELDRVGKHYRKLGGTEDDGRSYWTNACPVDGLHYLDVPRTLGKSDFLAYAVSHGLTSFVRQRLLADPTPAKKRRGWPFLNYALHSFLEDHTLLYKCLPSYDLVKVRLAAGADVNQQAHVYTMPSSTVWQLFPHRCKYEPDFALWPIAKLLPSFGADVEVEIKIVGPAGEYATVAESLR